MYYWCYVEVVAISPVDPYVSLVTTYHSLFWQFLFCYCSSPSSCQCQYHNHLSRVVGLISLRISLIATQSLQKQVQMDFHLFKWLWLFLWLLISFYFGGWNLCFLLIREWSVKDLDHHFLVFQQVSGCWGTMNWEQVAAHPHHCANLSLVVIPQLFPTEDFDHGGDLCHYLLHHEGLLTSLVVPVNNLVYHPT